MHSCRALEKTRVDADEVNYINAHATSTPAGDLAEYRAIKQSFPGKHVRMNATKSMTGHLLGGAGAIEAIVCVEAIKKGWQLVHPWQYGLHLLAILTSSVLVFSPSMNIATYTTE